MTTNCPDTQTLCAARRESPAESPMPHGTTVRSRAGILATAALGVALASIGTSRVAEAQCARLTRPIAVRLSQAFGLVAPAWARPLVAPAMLVRFEATNFRQLTYFLGYSALSVERLGVNGASPFVASVVIRCRGLAAEVVREPLEWATRRARELHVSLGTAEQAAGYTAEVVQLGTGRRPEGAMAQRRGALFHVTVNLSPRQGDTAGTAQTQRYEVTREGAITTLAN